MIIGDPVAMVIPITWSVKSRDLNTYLWLDYKSYIIFYSALSFMDDAIILDRQLLAVDKVSLQSLLIKNKQTHLVFN